MLFKLGLAAIAALALTGTLLVAPGSAIWLAPAAVPALASPLLIWATSHPMRRQPPLLFRTETEVAPSPVVIEQRQIMASWTIAQTSTESRLVSALTRTSPHVHA